MGSLCLFWALFPKTFPWKDYFSPESNSYDLPWEKGQEYYCIQGNGGLVSHYGKNEYALDFLMPNHTKILAARGGVVHKVVDKFSKHGYKFPNNLICIRHSDNTYAYYLHIAFKGSQVQVKDKVKRGQWIALSGGVGNSLVPHLHFHVKQEGNPNTIPVTFRDVPGDGIPKMFKTYKAGGPN